MGWVEIRLGHNWVGYQLGRVEIGLSDNWVEIGLGDNWVETGWVMRTLEFTVYNLLKTKYKRKSILKAKTPMF